MDFQLRSGQNKGKSFRPEHLWCGHQVKVVDGTTLSMPDTVQNQSMYPQPSGQKKGCGFPVMRMVASFSLATGVMLSHGVGPLKVHERKLWHQVWGDYEEGDVVLADCGFCAYADYALLTKRSVHCVMGLHQARKEKTIIKKFNENDLLIQWDKPKKRPDWISPEQWTTLPEKMTVRHVTINIGIPGFRTKSLVVATTLLDEKKYPREAIAALYRKRWLVEIFFRDMKITMRMDILRCQTPKMVQKELTIFIIAYNLIRILIWEAVSINGGDPFRISMAGTIEIIRQWTPMLAHVDDREKRAILIQCMMQLIAEQILPDRWYRKREPRAKKRRGKNYQLLTKPRGEFIEAPNRHKYKKI